MVEEGVDAGAVAPIPPVPLFDVQTIRCPVSIVLGLSDLINLPERYGGALLFFLSKLKSRGSMESDIWRIIIMRRWRPFRGRLKTRRAKRSAVQRGGPIAFKR